MTEPIRGKIARILNAREIALNVGTAKGVTVGMHFDVMDAYEDISDPDTGEVLGAIERPKVRLEITQAQEKLSVATRCHTKRIQSGKTTEVRIPAFGPFARALMPPSWVEKYENGSILEDVMGDLNEKGNQVKTGDLVVQVLEIDEPEQENTNEN